ncbi:MAG TPA: polysaccharide deacetylase family protein [Xanthobacteraceae bacterium]|jgi:peptidoglycan/xylan/chitin deacetylase (PgdA/CDA1 family)
MEKSFHWPHGYRIAVTVTVMLETWSEGKAPPYSVQASPLKPGTVDLAGIAWGSYGGKIGVYRIINLLKEHGLKGTFCVNGRCAEIFPDAVAQIVKSGHDVAGHAYLQDQVLSAMTPEDEKATIENCLALLEKVSGMRPKGWVSPSMAFTPHTRDFLAAQGMLWHGDARDSDLPRVVDTSNGPIVHIPGSDFTDNRVLRSSSLDLWDVYRETFDYLYLREPGSFLPLSMHCQFGGRPMITAIFHKIFSYMRQFPEVWFASYGDIAQWVMDNKLEADPRRLLKA